MKFILALLIFSLIIVIHEMGHFLLAKRGGIRVNEFSLGMGPRLFSRQIGETLYSIKLLPFGGSCMMEGEEDREISLFPQEAEKGPARAGDTYPNLVRRSPPPGLLRIS